MTIFVPDRPFNLRYAVQQHTGNYSPELLRAHRTATATWHYINRQKGMGHSGEPLDWTMRKDLVATGRRAPKRAQDPAFDGLKLWQSADRHARIIRPDEPVCAHAVGSLPVNDSVVDWRDLIEGFCEDFLVNLGMVTDWAIHYQQETADQLPIHPHVHMQITMRVYDPSHADVGRVRMNWLRTEVARKTLAERWWKYSGIYPKSYQMAA